MFTEQERRVATMMAAAYWRGRLENVMEQQERDRNLRSNSRTMEAMVKAAAACDFELWIDAARVAIGIL